jgi:outer membrane protein
MRKMIGFFLGVVFALTILTGTARAAEKFAYVDVGRIFSEYSKTKDFDKVLTDKENTYTTEREKKVNEIKNFQDKLNLLSEKEKEAKKQDLEMRIQTLQDFDRDKQTDLRKEQDEKMKDILKDIEDAVKGYASKEGLTFVFNDRILVYQDKNLDITDKIIKILNGGGYKK